MAVRWARGAGGWARWSNEVRLLVNAHRADGRTVLFLHDGDAGVVNALGYPDQPADGGEAPGRPGERVLCWPDCRQAWAKQACGTNARGKVRSTDDRSARTSG